MAQTTTNYGLLKPEATDSYNHLIYDNPNMDTIDAALKANSDAAISSATCIKSGTTHTITRTNPDASVFKFTATGNWDTGDTMIVDGVTVTPYLVTGEALKTGAFLINGEVLVALSGTRATVFSNQADAGTTIFDDSNVSYTASDVQDALEKTYNLIVAESVERVVIPSTDFSWDPSHFYYSNQIMSYYIGGRDILAATVISTDIDRVFQCNISATNRFIVTGLKNDGTVLNSNESFSLIVLVKHS